MATKKLAKELGLVRKRSQSSAENHEKQIGCRQFFSYLIVIDFESTCWKDKNNYGQEIIEFPAVLMNTTNGKIDSEFHTYVQPQEHPILSEFCTELTGICQAQVEAGVPLQICLSLFTRWIQTLQQEKNIVFVKDKASVPSGYPCAFVTWSDWDLGVCLQYECKRKQIPKPDILNSWIDLRATYKIFYNRKPKGLNGALQDLGIEFSGREHSGLDDARNTAHLAWRMIKDGCLMKVTRSLDRALLRAKPLFPINPNTGNVGGQTVTEDGKRKSVMKQSKLVSCEKAAVPSENNPEVGEYQSLVLPKTLLQGLGTPVFKGKTFAPAVRKLVSKGSSLSANIPSLMNSNLVLVSTTVDCHTAEPGLDTTVTDSVTLLGEWEETPVLVESEESCSYDDVLLEESDPSVTSFMDTFKTYDSNCVQSTVNSSTVSDSVEHSNQIVFQNSNTILYSLEKSRSSPSRSGVFKTPLLSNRKLSDKMVSHSKVTSSANPMATCSVAKSTRLHMIQPPISHMTPTSSFTIYKDVNDSNCSAESKLSCGSNSTPSLLPPSSTNRMSLLSRSNMKTTSPLCNCGRRAKRLTVANGGPNHGRVFFSCSIGKMGTGNKKSCGFFKWESSLTRAKSTAAAATPCSIPGTSFMCSGKSFSNKTLQISPHNFAMRPSLRN